MTKPEAPLPAVPPLPVLPGRTLRRQMLWLVLAAILASGAALAGMVNSFRTEALRSAERVTEAFAHVIAEQTARTFQTIDLRLQLSAARLDQIDRAKRDEGAAPAVLKAEISELPFLRALSVSDAEGRILYSTEEGVVGNSLADRAYFQIYRQEPQTTFYVGAPVRGRANPAWLISASRPLRSSSGAFAGVIVAAVEPRYFVGLWQTRDLGRDASIALFRRDGVLMVRSPFEEGAIGRAFPNVALFAPPHASRIEGHFVATSVVDGTRRLFGYRALPGRKDLVVAVGQAYDGVMAPTRRLATVVSAVWAAASVIIAILGVFLDRAGVERLRAAADAQRLTERLVLATEASSVGVWDWDLEADRWYATPTYFAMLGYGPDEGVGRRDDWLGSVHPEDRGLVAANIQAALEGADVPYRHDARVRHADGSYRWMSVTGRVLARDGRGKPSRLLGVMVDITESRRVEEALRASETFSLSILDSVTAEIAVLDRKGVIVAVNEPWKRFSRDNGIEPGRPAPRTDVGTNYLSVLQGEKAADEAAMARAGIEAVLEGRVPGFSLEYPCHSPTQQRWFTMNATPLGRDRLGVVVAHIDITERRRAEEALRLSLREKEGLLKEIHHRVKNNLQVITSLLRLESSRTHESGTRGVLKEMQGRIRSMALLHETLYRSGNFARVELGEYLRQLATQLFRAQNTAPGRVQLVLELSPATLTIDHAIPCGLIVNELLTNSLKYAFPHERSGEVRLLLEREEEDRIRIRVSDTGVGLPEDFDARRGSSLGLHLVSDLARQLGGSLEIGPPPGAVFTVTFKADDEEPAS